MCTGAAGALNPGVAWEPATHEPRSHLEPFKRRQTMHRRSDHKRGSYKAHKRRASRTDRLNLASPRRGGIRL